MTTNEITRAVLLCTLLLSGAVGCRDVGVVGEGSTCPEGCDTNERCVGGACLPQNDGVAGDDEHEDDEHEDDEHEDEPSEHEEE